ncbi:MAG: LysR substrate-binding domain-containing protein [Pseudomonadota bacterium]
MNYLPTIRQLQFLCALADHGTFSKAADACLVAQPTLSAAIREIEAALGAQLVERGARSTELTRAGEAAVARARRILAEAEDLVAEARQAAEPLAGPFRLGAIPTIAPFVLPKTLRKLRQSYPDLKLILREEKTAELLTALRSRTLDAAIIALPWPTTGVEIDVIAEDEFFLALPNGHRLTEVEELNVSSLLGEQVLLLEDGHCLRGHAEAVCTMPGIHRRNDVTATSLQTMIQMVGGGLGLSLVPKIAAEAGIARGAGVTVRPFDETVPGRNIGMAWRAGSSRKDEALIISEVVRGQFSKAS